jgi:hypothetical protein
MDKWWEKKKEAKKGGLDLMGTPQFEITKVYQIKI